MGHHNSEHPEGMRQTELGWIMPILVYHSDPTGDLEDLPCGVLETLVSSVSILPGVVRGAVESTGLLFDLVMPPEGLGNPEIELSNAILAINRVAQALRTQGLRDLTVEQAWVPLDGRCQVCEGTEVAIDRVYVRANERLGCACRPCVEALANLADVYVVRNHLDPAPIDDLREEV
jgi:hypothetical protein